MRDDRGSVTVEAALALCSLVLVLALALAGVSAVIAQVRCVDAAREAARLAARGEADRAADVARRIAPPGAAVRLDRRGDEVSAQIVAAPAGGLLPGIDVRAEAVAVVEPGVLAAAPAPAGPDPPARRPAQRRPAQRRPAQRQPVRRRPEERPSVRWPADRSGHRAPAGGATRAGGRSCGRSLGDRGAATVWVAGAITVVMIVAGVGLQAGSAVVARHHAGSAADLAALAGAGGAAAGETTACAQARRVTDRMRARMVTCEVRGWDVLVRVTVRAGLGRGWLGEAHGRARAGPVTTPPTGPIPADRLVTPTTDQSP